VEPTWLIVFLLILILIAVSRNGGTRRNPITLKPGQGRAILVLSVFLLASALAITFVIVLFLLLMMWLTGGV
jgi:hypothetical protein